MSLSEQINQDLQKAMKAREKDKLDALRAAKTAFVLARTEKGADHILPESDEIKIIQKLVKQRKEAAEIYKEQNRNDLYEKEMIEARALEVYLPRQMSEEELVKVLKEIISQAGATSMADIGKVMGVATKQLAGKADNKQISNKVRELLS